MHPQAAEARLVDGLWRAKCGPKHGWRTSAARNKPLQSYRCRPFVLPHVFKQEAEARLVDSLREEVAAAEARLEDERRSHAAARAAAAGREAELQAGLSEAGASVGGLQRGLEVRVCNEQSSN